MTNKELIDLMMARLGGRTAPALRSRLVIELNEKIRQLETGSILPWFMEDKFVGDTVANQDYVDLPADFVREVEEGRFKIKNTENKWGRLIKASYEDLEDETENYDAALPEGYALFGDKIYFGPVPDLAYSFKLPYFKRTGEVIDNTSAVTNSWLLEFHHYVTLATLKVVASMHIQSAEIMQKIDPELQTAYDIFWRTIEARKHTNMEYLLTNSEN
jgi:hypothetical protein